MSQYTVNRRWCVHSEGTKFYQIFEIVGPSGSAAVNHWGPSKGLSQGWRPRHDGQSQSMSFTDGRGAAISANETQKKKRARGYDRWTKAAPLELDGVSNLNQWAASLFTSAMTDDIMKHVSRTDVDTAKRKPKVPAAKPAPIPAPEPEPDRGDLWGSY